MRNLLEPAGPPRDGDGLRLSLLMADMLRSIYTHNMYENPEALVQI